MNWNDLYNEHGQALLLYARQWCGSMADAEEAVQNAFVKVWKAYEKDPSKITAPSRYLYRSVKNAAIDLSRMSVRRYKRETEAAGFQDQYEEWFHNENDSTQNEELSVALKQLPEEQREVIILKIWGKLTFKDIAEELGESQNTVASRYRYGLKHLSKMVSKGATA
ncbi:MAG: sigma-70 family RNA polymerase sigma factor [Lentisphaeria bacterium]|nr:sigma-70 family RNA polymerase sigma factor [Lentisphaeria bacterium]